MNSTIRSDFLHILTSRGFLHQATDLEALDALLANNPAQTAYIGFDATATSLHVGSLIAIMMLRHLQQAGGRPIVLMGGGTSLVGDPSGKDEARKMLTRADINNNIDGIKRVFAHYIDFNNDRALLLDNADWLLSLSYIDFLRDIGRHFSVNKMLQMDSVKTRLAREQNLSFLEFNYMVLQAFDFMTLHKNHDCILQMGGSDQWGNIVMGVDLTRRLHNSEQGTRVFGLTAPLLTTATGAKMGKTAAGAVWLSGELLSAYDFWQFWRNCDDADVGRFLKLFTELPLADISKLEKLQGQELNEAKKILADEITCLCHGRAAAAAARQTADAVFGGMAGNNLANLPTITISNRDITDKKIGLLAVMHQLGFAESNSAARRLVEQGGVRLKGQVVTDPQLIIDDRLFGDDQQLDLQVGKKKHGLIKREK